MIVGVMYIAKCLLWNYWQLCNYFMQNDWLMGWVTTEWICVDDHDNTPIRYDSDIIT